MAKLTITQTNMEIVNRYDEITINLNITDVLVDDTGKPISIVITSQELVEKMGTEPGKPFTYTSLVTRQLTEAEAADVRTGVCALCMIYEKGVEIVGNNAKCYDCQALYHLAPIDTRP